MTSLGTIVKCTSKIFLVKDNSVIHQNFLLRLLGNFVGTKRKAMLVIDVPKLSENYNTDRVFEPIGLIFI